MKRHILSLATALVLIAAGAVFAQSTLNTPAPGPAQETKPGQTNNNLQNPGSHNQLPTPTTTTTTTVPNPAPSTAAVTSTDMNNDSTSSTVTPPATTTAPAPDTTTTTTTTPTPPATYNSNPGTLDNTATSTTTSTLPKTASDLPTVALMGLLALSGFFAVRAYAKRNA